jgi:DNA-binding GntR family transcriptional regulator
LAEPKLSPRPLKYQTLGVAVAQTLRDMILTGELAPGRRTTQDELAATLGVSTMPVREALLRLAAEGFVEVALGRSFTIARTSRADRRASYWVHALVAGELTRRACVGADDELLARLEAAAGACVAALRGGDSAGAEAANWEFHKAINSAAGAPKLVLVLQTTLRFIPRGFYALVPAWRRASKRGHDEILTAFRADDPDQAAHAAEEHVREAGRLLIEFFSNKGYWSRPT